MRSFLTKLFRSMLRTFYRRIEVNGLQNVPAGRGVMFAVNHPNGLVDPLFILCFAGRPVSFLGKAPLFHYPIIGWFVRKFETIPVHRREDETAGSNRETFARARELLAGNGSIAIFPEGTTHSDARLRELKTGAARIALGATVDGLVIVPAGIYYSAKGKFRSDALVLFGPPIVIRTEPVDENGEPSPESVEQLTDEIRQRLAGVTLQADSLAALELVGRAEAIFSGADFVPVAGEFALRRRFVKGYHFLCERDPARLARLESAVTQFAEELGRARLEPHELVLRFPPLTILWVAVQLPLAALGAVVHYPTYRLVAVLSKRFAAGEDEMMATLKFVASLLLYPLTWIVEAIVVDRFFGAVAGLGTLIVLPFLGWATVRVFETADVLVGRLRATRRGRYHRLLAAREEIRKELFAVADEMGRGTES